MPQSYNPVIVALDYPDAAQALSIVDRLDPSLCRLKVGKELFTIEGPDLVRQLVDRGYDVFLDLKFHDIPTTVSRAVSAACRLGVWMLDVHALGGKKMMAAARQAVDDSAMQRPPLLIAVSILTSTSEADLQELGFTHGLRQTVSELTARALESGVDGMVCSAAESAMLREQFGDKPVLVTPGIRPVGSDSQDQNRVMTPRQALQAGSSYLVIGRPITRSEEPIRVLKQIRDEIAEFNK